MKLNLLTVFLVVIVSFAACKRKEAKYEVTFEYISNIENASDIELLIKKRLIIKDSIKFDLSFDNGKGIIEIYSDIDTSVLKDILLNQVKDGCYKIYNNLALYDNLLRLNDSLGRIRKENLIFEIKKRKSSDKLSLNDKVNIINDTLELNEIMKRQYYPLFEIMRPSADYFYGSKIICKSIGYLPIDSLDKVIKILSNSSLIAQNTKFLVSNVSFSYEYRELFVIDNFEYTPIDSINQDTSLNRAWVYNNIVQTSIQELEKSKQNKDITSFDLSENEIERYVNLMLKHKFLEIKHIKINAR